MLRIVQESEGGQTIKLEGKIVGPWVAQLNRSWHSLAGRLVQRNCTSTCAVWLSSMPGEDSSSEIYQKTNSGFLADSPLTRYFADDAMQQSPENGEEGV